LKSEIENVAINSFLQPEVTFVLRDDLGHPVALEEVSARFILARLEVIDAVRGVTRYTSYTTQVQTVPQGFPNAGASGVQATYDSGGIFEDRGSGRYIYIFAKALPPDFNRTLTHTVSAQIERRVGEKRFIANPLYHFVPDGSEVNLLRKVITTEGCNKCHTSLGLHGGGRREGALCILCHSPQSTDPDTGSTLDMAVMIHKIHRGAELPSVQAGIPYRIVGYRQSIHDYSDVEFPMDIRNCKVCHAGPQGDIYKTAPSRAVCGSCHDDVNFASGERHGPRIPQSNDDICTACHIPEGPEFGIGIAGAHTIPGKSHSLRGLIAEILDVKNAAPGQKPTVYYTLKQKDGTQVDPSTLRTVAVTFGGPTKEYTSWVREDATNTSKSEIETWSYTFTAPIPPDAEGTYAFAIEARRDVALKDRPEGEEDIVATEAAVNPVKQVAVTGTGMVERRKVVDLAKCNACHDNLSLHGSLRNQVEYCVVCHNPVQSDIARRPEGVPGGESVSFAYMIHRIHTGEELNQPYAVYGYGNRANDFSHILFSGKREACGICHVQDVPSLPVSRDAQPIHFVDKDGKTVSIPPTGAACNSCHDMREAVGHARLNTTSDGVESCAVCHRAGRSADIAVAHQVMEFLNVSERIGPLPTNVESWDLH
jgi:OmcA/MtrC family decaheme c-type cytochrome